MISLYSSPTTSPAVAANNNGDAVPAFSESTRETGLLSKLSMIRFKNKRKSKSPSNNLKLQLQQEKTMPIVGEQPAALDKSAALFLFTFLLRGFTANNIYHFAFNTLQVKMIYRVMTN